jgi:1-acyl-sn-glycerol-3-phosphate acyltransferase
MEPRLYPGQSHLSGRVRDGTMGLLARPHEVYGPARAIARGVERVIRSLGTGLLFAIFGIGGLLLATLVIPVMAWLRGDSRDRELRAQRIVHHSFRLFTWFGSLLRLLALEEHGTERLRAPGQLVIANHPSLLDVVYLISRMPQADCVVKRELWRNPMLRFVVRICGYIPNDGGEAVVQACSERLGRGRSVILFPEGSRSPYGRLGRFQRGAAYVALASKCPVTPVTIQLRPPALKKGQPWYALPNERLKFSLDVGESFFAHDLLQEDLPRTIAARRITVGLRSLFDARLADESP